MPNPAQMFDHTLDALKGWPAPNALDFVAKLSTNVTLTPVPAGRCVHNTASGFEMGVILTQMPIFLLNGSTDADVANAGGDLWTAIAPAGFLSGLVATGGYELETTEFDTAQTYALNDHLKAIDDNAGATGGTLTNQSLGTLYHASNMEARVGVVSRGKRTNAYGKSVLSFWPVYLPGSAT